MNKIIKLITIGVISIPLFGEGKISGYMFGDFYFVALHHDSTLKNMNGFWFRRIYFTYDYDISESFSTRLRLEFNSPGDFKKSELLIPYVKDAYLKWKFPLFDFIFGLSATPTWEVIEEHFGYRSIEKTPLDLQKMGSSRDIGFAFKGGFGESKKIKYHLMFANGEGTKSELNKQKAFYFSLDFYLGDFLIEFYGDYFDKGAPDLKYKYTYQGFIGLKKEKFRFGAQFANQTQVQHPDTTINYPIGSFYFVFNFSEKTSLIFRFDKNFEKNPNGNKIAYTPFSPDAPSNFIILGYDFKLHKNVNLIPNIKYVLYDEEDGIKPDPDLYLNLTFFYKF